ncbi:cellulose binding domain-containing protein [Streptomyces sp. ND04-05B]|uniref:cellulose binding domain-containing protein n=1 Tax=Streptomyces sp. ND04-05B TaxID=3028693 RepID=UPI0029B1A682|nr:cellulose binding domain-containing protein [Streptomyces sp. ND04-05B]MDX3068223.1 cellulose binding domain-containing protein [Streptomyces sp. ND04-05B]
MAYRVGSSWGSGFTAEVTVRNTGTTAVDDWRLVWSFAGAEKVTNAWNASVTQSGSAVTAAGAAHNKAISPGGSASFGFQASGAPGASPSDLALNGVRCG